MTPPSYASVLATLDVLANIGLLVVAVFALEQLRIAKTDISTRIRREAAKETALQLDLWATKIIVMMNKAVALQQTAGLRIHTHQMERFDMQELNAGPGEHGKYHNEFQALMKSNKEFREALIDTCNAFEASAMCFMTGVADEQIAFMPLSGPYCSFIERTYPVYCGMRKQGQLARWDYMLKLYRVWSQRRLKFELDAKQETLSKAITKANKDGAPIPPLGT